MTQQVDTIVDDMKFTITLFNHRIGKELDLKISRILSRLLKGLGSIIEKKSKDEFADSNINLSMFADQIVEILTSLTVDEFNDIEYTMLSYVIHTTSDGKKISLQDQNQVDQIFTGKNLTVIKLMIEIMKANNFCFFVLLGGGGVKTII